MNVDFTIVLLTANSRYKANSDIIKPLMYALRQLGYSVDYKENSISKFGTNIVFGIQDFHALDIRSLPENIIIYNVEQAVGGSKAMYPHYLKAMARFPVWDYSKRNALFLSSRLRNKRITHVPFGYVNEMTHIKTDVPKDIDVLFYGGMTDRRRRILEALARKGVEVAVLENIFGSQRDDFISRSKLVLNIHFYRPAILEVIRLGYLLANRKVVVSECNADTEMHEGLEDACFFAPYDKLVDTIINVLRREDLMSEQADRGFASFTAMPYTKILETVLSQKAGG